MSWRPTPLLDARGWSVLLNALATLAERIDAPVRWMAFHRHQDAPLLQQLIDQNLVPATLISRSTTVVPTTLETVFASVRTARLVIPMRLHALILARLACCPVAALSYDPKVEAAAAGRYPCSTLGALRIRMACSINGSPRWISRWTRTGLIRFALKLVGMVVSSGDTCLNGEFGLW